MRTENQQEAMTQERWDRMTPQEREDSYKQNVRGLLVQVGTLCDLVESLAELLCANAEVLTEPTASVLVKAGMDAKERVKDMRDEYQLDTLLPQIKAKIDAEVKI